MEDHAHFVFAEWVVTDTGRNHIRTIGRKYGRNVKVTCWRRFLESVRVLLEKIPSAAMCHVPVRPGLVVGGQFDRKSLFSCE